MQNFKKQIVMLLCILLLGSGISPYLAIASEKGPGSKVEISLREDLAYNLTATPTPECNAILLEWKDVHPGQWYMPYMITADGPYPLLDYAIPETQYLHTERLQNVEYCYYIQAFDVNGVEVGDKSKTVCVTIKCSPTQTGRCCPQIVEGLFSGKHMQMLNADGSWTGVNVIPWDAANTSSWKNEKVDVLHECGANWIYGAGTWNNPSTIKDKKQTYRLKFTIPPGPCTQITIKTFIDDEATFFLQKAGGSKKQVWTKNGTGYYEFDLTYIGSEPENCLSSGSYTLTIEHYDRIQIRYGLIFAADCKECCIETWTGTGATSNCETPDGSCQLYLSYQIDNINGRKQYSGEAAYQHILQQGGFMQSNGQLYGNIVYNTTPKVVQNRTLLPPRDISNWVPGAYIHWKVSTKEAIILIPKNIPCEDEKDQYAGPWRVAILKIGNNQIRSGELPSFPGGPSALVTYCSQTNDNTQLIPSPITSRLVDPTNPAVVPIIIGGFTMVPLRAITEVTTGSSSNVHWLPQHKTASIWFATASRCCCEWGDVGKITKITKSNISIGAIDRTKKQIIITRSGYTIEFTLCNGETKTYQVTDDFMDESKYATLSEVAGSDMCVRLCIGRDPVNPRNAREMVIKWIICGTDCCNGSGGRNPCPCGSECEWTKCVIIQSVIPSNLVNQVTITIKDCATGAIMQLMGDPNLFAINANTVTWGGSPTLIKYQVGMCAKYCIIKSDTIPPYYSIVKWEAIAPTDPCCCSGPECEWTNCVTIQSVVTNGTNPVKITIKDCQTGEIKDIFGDPNLYSINSTSVTWGSPTIAKYEVGKCAKYCLIKDVATAIWKIVKWEAIAPTDPCCCSGNCTWTGKGKVINANQSTTSTLDFDNNCDGIKDITYNINYILVAENPQAYDGPLGRYRGCADLCVDPQTNTVIRWKAYPNDPECCPPACNLCPCENSLVQNWNFAQGLPAVGGVLSSKPIPNWSVAYGSPDLGVGMGCCDNGFIGMWGNKVVGEAIQQNLTLGPGTYKISFCARRLPEGDPQPNNPPKFHFSASNGSISNPLGGTDIGTSDFVTSTDWQCVTLPNWTTTASFNTLTIGVTNDSSVNDGNAVSYGHIDRICIEKIDTPANCCRDWQLNIPATEPNSVLLYEGVTAQNCVTPGTLITFARMVIKNNCKEKICIRIKSYISDFFIADGYANYQNNIGISGSIIIQPNGGVSGYLYGRFTMPKCKENYDIAHLFDVLQVDCNTGEEIPECPGKTVSAKCCPPACNLCPCENSLVQNWNFAQGLPATNGDLSSSNPIPNWSVAYHSPQIIVGMGCCDNGFIQMWGNKVKGEAIQQSLPLGPGTYKITFCAKKMPEANQDRSPPKFQFRASNGSLTSPSGGTNIGISDFVTSTTDWQCVSLPNWSTTSSFNTLTISVTNDSSIDDEKEVSWGFIDRICIEKVATNCCDYMFRTKPEVKLMPLKLCPGEEATLDYYELFNNCPIRTNTITFIGITSTNANLTIMGPAIPFTLQPQERKTATLKIKMPSTCTANNSYTFSFVVETRECGKKEFSISATCKDCTCCDFGFYKENMGSFPDKLCAGKSATTKVILINNCKTALTFSITGNTYTTINPSTLTIQPSATGSFDVTFIMPRSCEMRSYQAQYTIEVKGCKPITQSFQINCDPCQACCDFSVTQKSQTKTSLSLCPGEKTEMVYTLKNNCKDTSIQFTLSSKDVTFSQSSITLTAGGSVDFTVYFTMPRCNTGERVNLNFIVRGCDKEITQTLTIICKDCSICCDYELSEMYNPKELCPGEKFDLKPVLKNSKCNKSIKFVITPVANVLINGSSSSFVTPIAIPAGGTMMFTVTYVMPECKAGEKANFSWTIKPENCEVKTYTASISCKSCVTCTNVTLKISKFDLRGGSLDGSTTGRNAVSMRILFDVNSKAWGILAVGKCYEICYEVKSNRSGNYNWGVSIKEVTCPSSIGNTFVNPANAVFKNNFTFSQLSFL